MGADTLAKLGASSFADYLTLPIPFLKPLLMFLIPLASALTIFAAGNGMLNSNAIVMQAIAQERLFWNWSLITKLNRYHRPWVALLLQGILIFTIITLIPDINLVNNLCCLGITASFLLPFISLVRIQYRRKMYKALPLTIVAIIATLGISLYSWSKMGSTMSECMLQTLPLICLLVLGYILYRLRHRGGPHHKQDLQKEQVFYH